MNKQFQYYCNSIFLKVRCIDISYCSVRISCWWKQ